MILHPIIDLLKRIVIALPDYTGGGGQLPDGMNHIGSGEIMFATKTSSNLEIETGLDFIPKCVFIFTKTEPSLLSGICNCLLTRELTPNNKTIKALRYLTMKNNVGDENPTTYSFTTPDTLITDTGFNIYNNNAYYAGAITYYWFAFD